MKFKIQMIIISILLLICTLYVNIQRDMSKIFDVELISSNDKNKIISDLCLKQQMLEIDLLFENEKVPFILSENAYLISQSMNNNYWQGRLTNKNNYKLKIFSDNFNKKDVISSNYKIQLLIYNEEFYDIRDIYITGLPVICLDSDYLDDINVFGKITVIENNASGRDNIIESQHMDCRYHVRGASSYASAKKSYKVNLLNSKGESKKKSLLNMRDDNDWILNPLYLDQSKMREKIGYDIWNNLSSKFLHQMEYVELIVDNEYQGLYCLQEPVDQKTFSTSKNDSFLYSVKTWYMDNLNNLFMDDIAEKMLSSDDQGIIDEFEIDNFNIENLGMSIELLRVLKSNVYNLSYVSPYSIAFDEKNCIDYGLFLNMTMAIDNSYKNQKICIQKRSMNNYILYKTPWDLDISFQNENTALWNIDYSASIIDGLYINSNQEGYLLQGTKSKYFLSREKFYNEEYLFGLIDTYNELLTSSGAIQRETNKWSGTDFNESCNYLKDVIHQRIIALDEYYGGL